MSPTSYQTAPPRNKEGKLPLPLGGVNPPRPLFQAPRKNIWGRFHPSVSLSPTSQIRAAFEMEKETAPAPADSRPGGAKTALGPTLAGLARLLFIPLSNGTWRSPVAHLTGGQGVAGSNPAVPIVVRLIISTET